MDGVLVISQGEIPEKQNKSSGLENREYRKKHFIKLENHTLGREITSLMKHLLRSPSMNGPTDNPSLSPYQTQTPSHSLPWGIVLRDQQRMAVGRTTGEAETPNPLFPDPSSRIQALPMALSPHRGRKGAEYRS